MILRALEYTFKITVLLCCLLLYGCGNSNQHVLIKQVRLYDGSTIREQVDVLISDGVIISIGEHISDEAATIVDGRGKTIVPLLVNAHAHVHEPLHLKERLAQGIGTVLDLYTSSEKAKQLRTFNDSTHYATYYTSGPGATAPGGHGTQLGYAVPTVSHPGEASLFIRNRVDDGVNYIKVIREPLRSTLDFATIGALIEAAHQNGKLALAHISTLDDALAVSELKVDGFAHIWFDSAMDEEQLARLATQNLSSCQLCTSQRNSYNTLTKRSWPCNTCTLMRYRGKCIDYTKIKYSYWPEQMHLI
ncbi:amidohydrolase family protein [Pontibacter amylolyticus]|uniref:amidohydrolase family protein n=1 Tax=Pontibacter amylolyticus TaxID=1424080 RepID=UPI0016653BCB|nr:hypothetical protein [Pontibacter amylolyticus]